jgi:hypothetical protein
VEEEDLNEAYHVEDQVHEKGHMGEISPPHEDEKLVFDPPFNEDDDIQDSISHSHEDKVMVSCTPFLSCWFL